MVELGLIGKGKEGEGEEVGGKYTFYFETFHYFKLCSGGQNKAVGKSWVVQVHLVLKERAIV